MKKNRFNKIKINKRLVFLSVLVTLFLLSGSIFAVTIMKTVPQNIGFKDVGLQSLSVSMCLECHKGSSIEKHHKTPDAINGNCFACHKVTKPGGKYRVEIARTCPTCHNKSPHHKSKDAENKNCVSCHKTPGVSKYSTKVPKYKPSIITPTVKACRNCHGEGVVDNIQVLSVKKTHHSIKLKGCENCHEKDRKSQNIRNCERCHSVTALHEVGPHVEQASCKGCHEVKLDTKKPEVKKKATTKSKKSKKRKKTRKKKRR